MAAKKTSAADDYSYGKSVAYALGAGVLVLVVAVLIILVVAQTSAVAALIVAIVAVVVMVAVIALVSKRMLAGVQREIDERRAAADDK
ncbi:MULTISPECIES: hypothetical protein [Gordonia]|jgi:energy-coupling factor transporter transmembrane protein EcfT|uniref:Uncharacterized protein n=1 Tax=Gordonia malaquae NBRC 108250 TaxID=1223542 RepID=M3VDL4_GORML|nr:hypothetical protein [Gordonia malaquae]GAC78579.1 hypothetical protein GM1_004_00240 [Gordonia malaquae NBRC 108250]SED53855.1 hypothetical protein SAMN04488550_2699 [Gordonia malaquae]